MVLFLFQNKFHIQKSTKIKKNKEHGTPFGLMCWVKGNVV